MQGINTCTVTRGTGRNTSIRTRIETGSDGLSPSGPTRPVETLPSEQGLKQEGFRARAYRDSPVETLPSEQGLKLDNDGASRRDRRWPVETLPSEQGLKPIWEISSPNRPQIDRSKHFHQNKD